MLPYHLRSLAHVEEEVQFDIKEPVTLRAALEAIEARYPVLCGTIREHGTLKRRAFLRFFACEKDLSDEPLETLLPVEVANGEEPFLIVGAISGG
jgi:hypothetical protein